MTLQGGLDSMEYSGAKASATQQAIVDAIKNANDAYEAAFTVWNTEVAAMFTLGSQENTDSLFGNIVSVSRKELDKTGDELLELAKGINNINDSWVDLNKSISDTLRQYGTSGDGSGDSQGEVK